MADGLTLDLEVICNATKAAKIEDNISPNYVHADNAYKTIQCSALMSSMTLSIATEKSSRNRRVELLYRNYNNAW